VIAHPATRPGEGARGKRLHLEAPIEVVTGIVEAPRRRELEAEAPVIARVPEHEADLPAERGAGREAGPDECAPDATPLLLREDAHGAECARRRTRSVALDHDRSQEDVCNDLLTQLGHERDPRPRFAHETHRQRGLGLLAECRTLDRGEALDLVFPRRPDPGQPRFPAKKSFPLSSTTMKAGKPSTSIFQIASIPSSGYSTTSTCLMQFFARMAAGPPIDPR